MYEIESVHPVMPPPAGWLFSFAWPLPNGELGSCTVAAVPGAKL